MLVSMEERLHALRIEFYRDIHLIIIWQNIPRTAATTAGRAAAAHVHVRDPQRLPP